MIGKCILAVVTLLFGVGTYLVARNIHHPVPPASVGLSLGEQNRSERFIIGGSYGQISEPYVAKLDVTPATLPKQAWCDQVGIYREKLVLQCYWPTPGEATEFASGQVTIDNLPTEDVWGWNLNRDTLEAEAEMYGWLSINGGYCIGAFFMGLITLFCALFLFFPGEEKKKTASATI